MKALTVGGLAIGLVLLGVALWTWWKSPGRDPKILLNFGAGYCLGALSTVCGGILGVLSGWTAGLNNKGGEHAVPGTTGSGNGTINSGSAGQLTQGGGLAVFLLAACIFIAWRAAGKVAKRRLTAGWWSGATLTLSSGMAAVVGSSLLPGANSVGDHIIAWFNGGGGL